MKYAVWLLLVFVGMLGFNLWEKREMNIVTSQLNKQLMEAKLEIGKAQTQFGDANKYANELEQELQNEIEAKNESLRLYGDLLAKYNAKGSGTTVVRLPPETEVIEIPVETQLELNRWHFYWAETDRTLRDLGSTLPSGFQDHRITIYSALLTDRTGEIIFGFNYELKLKILGQLAQTTTESGAVNNYLTLWELDSTGKKVGKFQLTKFEVIVADERKEKLFWWAPHVDFTALAGYNKDLLLGGSVGISLSGYGKTTNDLSWRFARVGLTLSDSLGVSLAPVMYNLGEPLPLVSNIWIGPTATFDGKWGVALLLGAAL